MLKITRFHNYNAKSRRKGNKIFCVVDEAATATHNPGQSIGEAESMYGDASQPSPAPVSLNLYIEFQ